MECRYQVDLERITLAKFKALLEKGRLLPSQQVLREDLDERFGILKEQGIENIRQLQLALKTKKDVGACARETGIPENFLTVLRREANGYNPKPRALEDSTVVDRKLVSKLGRMGMTNTIQYLEKTGTKEERKQLARSTGASMESIETLTRLADPTRLRYVNFAFATLLLRAGYGSVARIADADAAALHSDLVELNQEEGIFGGAISLEDMESCVQDARQVPRPPIEY